MLFEAAYWRTDTPQPSLKDGLAEPEIRKILDGWDRDGDMAVIAHSPSNIPFGAAWIRYWTESNHSYGFVGESIPELGIGVSKDTRGKGIGRALLREIIRLAGERGIHQISLSVEVDNFSRELYLSEGFETVDHVGNAETMLKIL